MKRLVPLLALFLIAACNSGDPNATAGGVTPDEARALDDAAEMIESRRLPAEALQSGTPPAR